MSSEAKVAGHYGPGQLEQLILAAVARFESSTSALEQKREPRVAVAPDDLRGVRGTRGNRRPRFGRALQPGRHRIRAAK